MTSSTDGTLQSSSPPREAGKDLRLAYLKDSTLGSPEYDQEEQPVPIVPSSLQTLIHSINFNSQPTGPEVFEKAFENDDPKNLDPSQLTDGPRNIDISQEAQQVLFTGLTGAVESAVNFLQTVGQAAPDTLKETGTAIKDLVLEDLMRGISQPTSTKEMPQKEVESETSAHLTASERQRLAEIDAFIKNLDQSIARITQERFVQYIASTHEEILSMSEDEKNAKQGLQEGFRGPDNISSIKNIGAKIMEEKKQILEAQTDQSVIQAPGKAADLRNNLNAQEGNSMVANAIATAG